jgi:hypothetical protein
VRTDLLEHSGFDFKAMQKHIKTMNAVAELKAVQSRNKPLKNVFLWQGVVILEKDSKLFYSFNRVSFGAGKD